jgi:hypothetical protein
MPAVNAANPNAVVRIMVRLIPARRAASGPRPMV